MTGAIADLDDLDGGLSLILTSAWLMPIIAILVAADGPIPLLPTEALLTASAAAAVAGHDLVFLGAVFAAAVLGSVIGDWLIFGLGRISHRVIARRSADRHGALSKWVGRNIRQRPVITCVSARLIPGGRMISTAACGRLHVPTRDFAVGSLLASILWSLYMVLAGVALGPFTRGDPTLSFLAGLLLAAVTSAIGLAAFRIRSGRASGGAGDA